MTHGTKTLCAVLAIASPLAAGETSTDWVTTIPAAAQNTVADVVTDAAGVTFIAATFDFDKITLTRLESDGSTGWFRTFSGEGGQDIAAAATLSSDESAIYVLGRSAVVGAGSDFVILKYDAATGNPLWTRFVDGGDSGIDSPRDIAATPDGGVVATGGFDTATNQRDFGTVRVDANGHVMWTRTYAGFGQFLFQNDDATVVAVNDAGDVAISGSAMSGSDSDIVTLLYDGSTGQTVWEARWNGVNNDVPDCLEFAPDGDVVMLGIDDLTNGRRWVLASYDIQTGSENWSHLLNLGFDETARGLSIGPDGTVFATGSVDPDIFDSNSNDNLAAVAIDEATGALLWNVSFGGFGVGDSDYGARIHPDGKGSVWIVGGTSSAFLVPDPLESDGLLLELSAGTGGVRSITLLDTSAGAETNLEDLRHAGVDALGRLYTVGEATGDIYGTLAARFELSSCYTDFGGALAGSAGTPELDASGLLAATQPVTIDLTSGLPFSKAWLVVGFSAIEIPFLGGTLVPSPDLVLKGKLSDGAGNLSLPVTWPALPAGSEVVLQYWIADPGAPAGFSASNGLSLTQP